VKAPTDPNIPATQRKRSTTAVSVKKQIWIEAFTQQELVNDLESKVVRLSCNKDASTALDKSDGVVANLDGGNNGSQDGAEAAVDKSPAKKLGGATLEGCEDTRDDA
jgi:hypothetical protein